MKNKYNIVIRTYQVENLLNGSLFKLPGVVDSNYVRILVHNDNPDNKEQFLDIIDKFTQLYPEYWVEIIQETENKQMFMTNLECISKLAELDEMGEEYEWTYFLDDDDWLINDITNYKPNYRYASYVTNHYKNGEYAGTYPVYWWRIYKTNDLKSLLNYKNEIVQGLINVTGSTKYTRTEDKLLLLLVNELVFHHITYHINIDKLLLSNWIKEEFKSPEVLLTSDPIFQYNFVQKVVNNYNTEDLSTEDYYNNLCLKVLVEINRLTRRSDREEAKVD